MYLTKWGSSTGTRRKEDERRKKDIEIEDLHEPPHPPGTNYLYMYM